MKTNDELTAFKGKVETLNKKKLKKLTDEESAKVVGGGAIGNKQCENKDCADYGKEFNRALRICPTCHHPLFIITE